MIRNTTALLCLLIALSFCVPAPGDSRQAVSPVLASVLSAGGLHAIGTNPRLEKSAHRKCGQDAYSIAAHAFPAPGRQCAGVAAGNAVFPPAARAQHPSGRSPPQRIS